MRTTARLFLGCIVATLLCGSTAAAQELPGDARVAGIRLGALTVAPWFELRDMGMDTNILHETGAGVTDSVATAVAHLSASAHTPAFGVDTASAMGFDYFARYRDQRSLNQDHRLRLSARTRRVMFFASGAVLNTRERLNLDLDSRVRRTEKGITFGAAVRLSPKTAIEGDARRTHVEFAGDASIAGTPAKQVMQHRTDTAAVRVRYGLTRLTTLRLETDVEQTRFPEAPGRDSDSFRVMPGVEFQPLALIVGTAAFGYQSFRPLTNAFPRFSGVVGRADVSVPLTSATRLRLGAERDFEYSYQLTSPVYILGAARGGIVHRVGNRWEVELGTSRHRLAYRPLVGTVDEAAQSIAGRIDHFVTYHASLDYQATRFVRVGIRSEHLQRQSDLTTRRFEQFRVGAFVRYGILPDAGARR